MTDHDTCTEFYDGRGIVAPGPLRAQFVDAMMGDRFAEYEYCLCHCACI